MKKEIGSHICKINRREFLMRTAMIVVLTLIVILSGQTTARAADGDLDTTFNATVDASGVVNEIVVQPDGKIVIGGSFTTVGGVSRGSIARLNADGSLDATFGNNQAGANNQINAVALQADGKILIGGFFTIVNGTSRANLARLNADGTLDSTFAAAPDSSVNAIIVQSDGRIVIGGGFSNVSGTSRFRLAQLNSSGAVTSFNANISGLAQSRIYGGGLALQTDGKILVNGFFDSVGGQSRSGLARVNADGTVDTTFVPTNTGSTSGTTGSRILQQPDGRILAAISRQDQFGLRRFSANGTFESTFAPNTGGSSSNNVTDFTVQPDGKIIVVGSFNSYIARFNADGTLDTTFAPTLNNFALSIALQTDGKVLIGGSFDVVNDASRPKIARLLNGSGTIATHRAVLDFDGDGKSDYAIARAADANSPTNWFIRNSSNQTGSAVQFGTGVRGFGFTPPADIAVPEDFDGDGKTDIAVWRAGDLAYFYILQSATNTFRSEQFGKTGDNPTIVRDYDGDGKADVAVYREGTSASPQSFWYYRPSATASVDFRQIQWGTTGDFVAPGDYDGDGKGDFCVYRNVNGSGVFFLNKSGGGAEYVYFGSPTDQINPGDYDGDGKTDFALSRYDTVNTNNPVQWFILTRTGGGTGNSPIYFGNSTDFTVQGDYDGDGKTDIAVWRRGNGTFYVRRSGDGGFQWQQWGQQGDYPVGYYNAH